MAHLEVIEIIHLESGAAEDDPGVGTGRLQNGVPLINQTLGMIERHPVHVIQQYEARNARLGLAQEIGHGRRMNVQARQQRFEPVKVVLLEIFGAAVRGVVPLEINAPEIVLLEG